MGQKLRGLMKVNKKLKS